MGWKYIQGNGILSDNIVKFVHDFLLLQEDLQNLQQVLINFKQMVTITHPGPTSLKSLLIFLLGTVFDTISIHILSHSKSE